MAYTEYGVDFAVLNTGHGNPSAAYAASNIATKEGVPNAVLSLDLMGRIASVLHKLMTRHASGAYTEHSSNLRSGIFGDMLGAACYRELLHEIKEAERTNNFQALKLFVVQEFMLLGAKPEEIQGLYNEIFLLVPDVYPKTSAVNGLLEKEDLDAQIIVWNTAAYRELVNVFGMKRIKLFAPFLVEGLARLEQNVNAFDVIVKTSGSGGLSLKQARRIQDVCEHAGLSVFVHMPDSYLNNAERFEYVEGTPKDVRIDHFYRELSTNTKVIISYPSEMVQVASEMMAKGIRVKFIAFPPRGEHEARNLKYAVDAGLCVAVLSLDGYKYQDWGVPTIAYNEIPTFIAGDVSDRTVHKVVSLLGDKPVSEVLRPN